MTKTEMIRLLLTKSVEIQNRINEKIEILLKDKTTEEQGKKEIEDLIESIEYVTDGISNLIKR